MITTKQKKLNSVLLIDACEIDNFLHRKILENCGATSISTFENPVVALEYLEKTKDIPQLILLDLNFPIMNGFEFLEEFGKLEISRYLINIFILSATANSEDIEKAQQKCSGFIEKFLTKEKLITQLNLLDTICINKSDKG